MKKFLFLFAIITMFASCSKDASVGQPVSEQKARKEKASQSILTASQVLTAGEDDVVNISAISFGQGEGIYSNYSGNNVHATAHTNGNAYVQVFADGIWNSLLATSSNSVSAGSDVSAFDGYPANSSVQRIYRAMLIAADGSIHYSSEVQVN
jgi:hypothetical protein